MKNSKIFRLLSVLAAISILSAIHVTPVLAAESLTIKQTQAKIGDIINFSGAGYPSSRDTAYCVDIYMSSQPAYINAVVNVDFTIYKKVGVYVPITLPGTYSGSFVVPSTLDEGLLGSSAPFAVTPFTKYYIYTSGVYYDPSKPSRWIKAITTLTISPSVSPNVVLSPASGGAGTLVSLTGANFQPGANLIIQFDNTAIPPTFGDSVSLTNGIFRTSISIPSGTVSGTHTVTVSAGDTSASSIFTVGSVTLTTNPISTATKAPTSTPSTPPTSTLSPLFPDLTGNVILTTDHPIIETTIADSFTFNIVLNFMCNTLRVFNFQATAPSGWNVTFQPQDKEGTNISSITIDSSSSGISKTVILTAKPPASPSPGDYKIIFQSISGNISGSIELTARIVPKYELQAEPVNQLLYTTASSGKESIFSIKLTNRGTAPMYSVTFNSTRPSGWEIKFVPDKIDVIAISASKIIDVDIKPPAKTKAGVYNISLATSGNQTAVQKMEIMVTVKGTAKWEWIGIAALLVALLGGSLFVFFKRVRPKKNKTVSPLRNN